MKRNALGALLAAGLTFLGTAALAHHGSGGYDMQKSITLQGAITSAELINPHSFIYIDVKNRDGKVENWALEASPPHLLSRQGITKEMLMPGKSITVIGWPARNTEALSGALNDSSGATDRLKATHVLQIGGFKFDDGVIHEAGMGPTFGK